MCKVIGAASSFACVHGTHTHTHTHTHTKLQAAPFTVNVAFYYKSYIYDLTAVLPHTGGDRNDCFMQLCTP